MGFSAARVNWILAAVVAMTAGCEGIPFGGLGGGGGTAEKAAAPASVRLVERDVEAPQVFQVTEEGLWDGRPSLGGVWVAHPDVAEPERVIIRNLADDAFVIGALFRRERSGTGPALQVSSDAAEALGLVAGQPQRIEVTALRRESVPETPLEPQPTESAEPETAEPETAGSNVPGEESAPAATAERAGAVPEIITSPLAAAEAAIARADDAAEAGTQTATAAPPPPPPPTRAAPRPSSLDRPFIQIGFFSVRENAEATGARLRSNGILPAIREQAANGKTYWRVVVGPAGNHSERAALLSQIRDMGFADAYFVTD